MGLVRQGIDVEELADGLAHSTQILGAFAAHGQLFALDKQHVPPRKQAGDQEGQLVGHVGRAFIQGFQHQAVGKGACRVQHAVEDGQQQRQEGLGVFAVARLLTGGAQLVVLGGFHHAQQDYAAGHQRDGDQLQRAHIAKTRRDEGQYGHQRAGGIADGRGNGKLDVAQADIADGHGYDVEQRYGQVGQDDAQVDLYAVYEDFVAGVQAHHNAHGHDHLQVGGFIAALTAANFGKQIRAAPAQQGSQGIPEPHGCISLLFV